MKREILFRGKRKDTGEWIYGYLSDNSHIVETIYRVSNDKKLKTTVHKDIEIIPETVCQYTGLTDKNGKKIFEGDIVKVVNDEIGSPIPINFFGKVEYIESCFYMTNSTSYPIFQEIAQLEVIGNIHDYPELI